MSSPVVYIEYHAKGGARGVEVGEGIPARNRSVRIRGAGVPPSGGRGPSALALFLGHAVRGRAGRGRAGRGLNKELLGKAFSETPSQRVKVSERSPKAKQPDFLDALSEGEHQETCGDPQVKASEATVHNSKSTWPIDLKLGGMKGPLLMKRHVDS